MLGWIKGASFRLGCSVLWKPRHLAGAMIYAPVSGVQMGREAGWDCGTLLSRPQGSAESSHSAGRPLQNACPRVLGEVCQAGTTLQPLWEVACLASPALLGPPGQQDRGSQRLCVSPLVVFLPPQLASSQPPMGAPTLQAWVPSFPSALSSHDPLHCPVLPHASVQTHYCCLAHSHTR